MIEDQDFSHNAVTTEESKARAIFLKYRGIAVLIVSVATLVGAITAFVTPRVQGAATASEVRQEISKAIATSPAMLARPTRDEVDTQIDRKIDVKFQSVDELFEAVNTRLDDTNDLLQVIIDHQIKGK